MAPPELEHGLLEVLAEILGTERVSPDSHFFDDLDADSLVMARFCARVRKRAEFPPVSMKDIYAHPTVGALAAALPAAAPVLREPDAPEPYRASTAAYLACGAAQLATFLAYTCLAALALSTGYRWIAGATGVLEAYLRTVLAGAVLFTAAAVLPVAAKWLLVGRCTPRRIRVWSAGYFRFWLVKTLVRASPLVLFTGTPVYSLYLRALGARIGRGALLLSRSVPACPDLLSVGARAVLRKDSQVPCYRAHAGIIETGRVSVGAGALLSEVTVLDIDTSLGDGAQLGHASSLHSGQHVPAGERWHGSPAQRTQTGFPVPAPARAGAVRRFGYGVTQVLGILLVYVPLALGGADLLLTGFPRLRGMFGPTLYSDVLAVSLVLFAGAVLASLVLVAVLPRIAARLVRPERVHPLYGFRYSVHRLIVRATNVPFFTRLFGDSSYIVHYLRYLGYDLSTVEQTGSNFGTVVKHESPYLSSVGSGTMVADGLSMMNAEYSDTSFVLRPVRIGARSFLGNLVAYPPGGRTGHNCLLATKVMVPIDGAIRSNTGLLGSPSFEIPRTVERDSRFDITDPAELRRKLVAKNRHNLGSMALFLFSQWLYLAGDTMLTMWLARTYPPLGWLSIAAASVLLTVFTVGYFVFLERAATGFRALEPRLCSIYDPYFWWHERFWKMVVPDFLSRRFAGTPFKNLVNRLLGARLGRRVYDDGCSMPERTLTTIGDDCTLNAQSVIQCHSQEDGTFKSDRSTLGAGSTLGVGAFVHYGVSVGTGAILAPDSFLMKGEEIPARACWAGNPARPRG